MQRHGDEVDLTTDEARSGSTPHVVRYVLLISLFLAAAAMTVAWVTGALSSDQVREVRPAPRSAPAEPVSEQGVEGNLADDFTLEAQQEPVAAEAD